MIGHDKFSMELPLSRGNVSVLILLVSYYDLWYIRWEWIQRKGSRRDMGLYNIKLCLYLKQDIGYILSFLLPLAHVPLYIPHLTPNLWPTIQFYIFPNDLFFSLALTLEAFKITSFQRCIPFFLFCWISFSTEYQIYFHMPSMPAVNFHVSILASHPTQS